MSLGHAEDTRARGGIDRLHVVGETHRALTQGFVPVVRDRDRHIVQILRHVDVVRARPPLEVGNHQVKSTLERRVLIDELVDLLIVRTTAHLRHGSKLLPHLGNRTILDAKTYRRRHDVRETREVSTPIFLANWMSILIVSS